MKKVIKKYGETLVVSFDMEDRRAYGFEEGDILDFRDWQIIKPKDVLGDKSKAIQIEGVEVSNLPLGNPPENQLKKLRDKKDLKDYYSNDFVKVNKWEDKK